ncbi:MAG: DUF2891 domain-containing protein [Betaproteobacteria bacterium]
MTPAAMDAATASRFAAIALANIDREFPGKPDHVLGSDEDLRPPRELHPAFHGSYDWHSCVHMHWLLASLRRRFPGLAERPAIDSVFDRHFAPAAVAAECAYLVRPGARSFERTYGWAWLLKLADEISQSGDARARRWSHDLAPLAQMFVARNLDYLPKAQYPIRYGMHSNSAFGLMFALDYARRAGDGDLETMCVAKARAWYGADLDAPAEWEPSGADFLSPVLVEAELMRRVFPAAQFASWLAAFLPKFATREPSTLFIPAEVSDRSDPQIVHLDGLNLSRAWCFRGIAAALPTGDPRAEVGNAAAASHLSAGLGGLESTDYLGGHWLASFAALALEPDVPA